MNLSIYIICRAENTYCYWIGWESVEVLSQDDWSERKSKSSFFDKSSLKCLYLPPEYLQWDVKLKKPVDLYVLGATDFLNFLEFFFVIESFLSLEQLKQFNDENISAEDLLATVLNSSAPSSGQPIAGDLVMIVMGMDTVLSNLNSTQRMASAKVNYIGLLLCRCGNYLTIRFLW